VAKHRLRILVFLQSLSTASKGDDMRLDIDSKPLGGTAIHVRVPLGAECSFQT
jgi:hypothetical protein